MTNSSIYLNDLTAIDFSVITNTGQLVGGSATLNLEVSGPVDGHEGVVIDFSQCKKQIKALIDDPYGFDHKCWVPIHDPMITVNTVVSDDGIPYTTVRHNGTGLVITAHENAFTLVEDMSGQQDITNYLNEKLAPYVVSNVFLNTSIIPVPRANTDTAVFRYVHGLKNSSSFGCKNLVHGHKSCLSAVVAAGYNVETANQVLHSIAGELNAVIFADAEDLAGGTMGEYTISYTTKERGPMSMTFSQKLIVLETQTTVEYLVEYVRARFYDQLKAVGVVELFVSEGLCKGAKVYL